MLLSYTLSINKEAQIEPGTPEDQTRKQLIDKYILRDTNGDRIECDCSIDSSDFYDYMNAVLDTFEQSKCSFSNNDITVDTIQADFNKGCFLVAAKEKGIAKVDHTDSTILAAGVRAMVDHHIKNGVNGFKDCSQNNLYKINHEYTKMRLIQPLISKTLQQNADILGTRYEGLEHAVKTASSIADKLARQKEWRTDRGLHFSEIVEFYMTKDVVRYTEITDHEKIFSVAKKTIDQLSKEGYVLSGVKNYYEHPFKGSGYKGLHLNFITPYGVEIELQVHSEISLDAKIRGHAIYEQERSVSVSKEDKDRLNEEAQKIHSKTPIPADYLSLPEMLMPSKERRELMNSRKAQTKIKYKEQNGTIIYNISVEGKEMLSGYEHAYSDGSVNSYQKLEGDDPVLISVSKNGELVSAKQTEEIELTHENVAMVIKSQESEHQAWLKSQSHDEKRGLEIPGSDEHSIKDGQQFDTR